MITFKTIYKDKKSRARVGELHTPHGIVETPAFVPVGTQATVKSLTPDDLKTIGVQILFGNTYHLHLRPGEEIVEQFGGLGKFMHWSGVTMTDSGGFQVFSLARSSSGEANLVKITEDGVIFRSHLDGSKHTFTPEQSIAIQKRIGADIILAFDQCTTYPITHANAKADMERTHRWAIRSLEAFRNPLISPPREGAGGGFSQALYGIVQGSIFEDLRKESAEFIASQNFDGIAIGGVSVGETKKEMQEAVDRSVPYLPENKVRHLLGIGDVDDIFEIVERGIDTFDCVTPSRLGRVGHIFVHPPEGSVRNRFRYDVTKSLFSQSSEPLSIGCECYVCQTFTRGYIHHLFRAKELLAYRLATYHNIHFIINLTKKIRESLLENRFAEMKKKWLHVHG
ncbi:MAG TPA: tRNA guanosine(34) transglycosylase Tgt [Candidatus Saccharimonadales bacterium]|nr:tRNA guanosine(34) transglycosylase Tgt [Candidatus Saccharimonadales bacterium]